MTHISPSPAAPASAAPPGKAVTLQFTNNALLPLLLGDHDRYLVRIEQALGVRMSCRGNRVAIAGAGVLPPGAAIAHASPRIAGARARVPPVAIDIGCCNALK